MRAFFTLCTRRVRCETPGTVFPGPRTRSQPLPTPGQALSESVPPGRAQQRSGWGRGALTGVFGHCVPVSFALSWLKRVLSNFISERSSSTSTAGLPRHSRGSSAGPSLPISAPGKGGHIGPHSPLRCRPGAFPADFLGCFLCQTFTRGQGGEER